MLNRAAFRQSGLQGRAHSTEVFAPRSWVDRLKVRLPRWVQRFAKPTMESVGWRGRHIGSFLPSMAIASHRPAARREAQASIRRVVTGQRIRYRGRTRRKRMEQRLRALG